ncbi:MAG: PD-(D/E)XK nuclease family protein [Candidatus Thorarchaeota archaeon]
MAVAVERLTVADLKAMANQGLIELNRPTERIEYTTVLEPYDIDEAIFKDLVRSSSISAICKRKQAYGEKYPKESQLDASTQLYDMAGTVRMLMGTAFHALPTFRRFGEVKEYEFELDGVTGHIDIWLPKSKTIIDIKTTGWIKDDPQANHVVQVATYYAAMNKLGHDVRQVFIWYIDRCLRRGTPVHEVFEIVFDHNDHENFPAFDAAKSTRFEFDVGWNIEHIWNDVVLPARQTFLDARKGILPERWEQYGTKDDWLCRLCQFKQRCKLNVF